MRSRRTRTGTRATTILALVLAGCGGEVRTGGPDPSGAGAVGPEGGAAQGSSPASGSGANGSNDPGTVALPDCPKGFKAGEAIGKLCVYTTNGLCYETKLGACACACTKQSGTVCASGFPEMDGTTKVTCH